MSEDQIANAAAEWHARQDAEDMDWRAFEAWLSVDPRHRAAFDETALLDADIDRHRNTLRRLLSETEADEEPRRTWWRSGAGAGALAAAAATAVLLVSSWQTTSPVVPPTIYRADATARDVQIVSARTTLAPGTTIVVEGDDKTRLALTGRAVFAVEHDPSRTLHVRAEGYDIIDVGTRFEIVAGAGIVRVSVSEGAIELRPANGGAATRIGAGRMATGLPNGRVAVMQMPKAAIGSWRGGPLVYDAMPLGLVAADVARASGRRIVADPAVADRSFSGVLAVSRGDAMVQALATLAGVKTGRQGDTIHLRDRVRR